jgi:hypothetical protein
MRPTPHSASATTERNTAICHWTSTAMLIAMSATLSARPVRDARVPAVNAKSSPASRTTPQRSTSVPVSA